MSILSSITNFRAVGPVTILSVMMLFLFISMALIPSMFAPYGPKERFIPYQSPSYDHFLGTNNMGNDIFSELIYGTRITLIVGFAAATITTFIGAGIGIIAGYFRGFAEEVLMGITDIALIIPKIPLIILIAAFLRPSIWILIIVLGLLSWESIARVVRSKTLQVKEAGFVKSAECMGFSSMHIMVSDIFPNIIHVIIPKFMLATASAMISEASLSFLGLGDPAMKSWGMMLSYAFTRGGFIREMWWWYLPPGICITLCVLSLVTLGFLFEKDRTGVSVE
jgi:peptide/nickel transport system permease protein